MKRKAKERKKKVPAKQRKYKNWIESQKETKLAHITNKRKEKRNKLRIQK